MVMYESRITKFRNMCYKNYFLLTLCFIFCICDVNCVSPHHNDEEVVLRYLPNWDSIDSRPLPKWYDDAKIGIFLHWGVYSVPGMHSEWFWWDWEGESSTNDVKQYMKDNYSPNFRYAGFAKDFKAQFFDPKKWAQLFDKSGAKYVVMTSKHHEGFTMWPSKYSWNWNSLDNGPHKDLVGMLAKAIKDETKLKFGLYYSLFEWFHPLYKKDKEANFTTQYYVESVSQPQIEELVNMYKPEVLWLDGDAGPPEYWKSLDILAWLYNDSPVKSSIVTNDRWGNGCPCHHGGYFTCEDKYNPGKLMPRKWENCMTIDRHSWGFRRDMDLGAVLSMEELITTLVETISYGGNILINVGPTADGIIVPIFEERLTQLGEWLGVNGDAIYGTQPWKNQREPFQKIWYTSKPVSDPNELSNLNNGDPKVYAIFLEWPKQEDKFTLKLTLLAIPSNTNATLKISILGIPSATNLPWKIDATDHNTVLVDLSGIKLESLPCKYAWSLKFETSQGGGSDQFTDSIRNNEVD